MNETLPRNLKIASSSGLTPWNVEWYASIDSTMNRVIELARNGSDDNAVIVADYQTAGRGTHGRSWVAPPGTCLMFSFVLRPDMPLSELTHLPISIAETVMRQLIDCYHLDVAVDPPNDLTIGGRKVAGILCQSHLRAEHVEWVACGVGLNTNLQASQITIERSTSILIESGREVPHDQLLRRLLEALEPLRVL